ncbi:uncharacterized protein [Centruroides vittatus]|uniref:uncharacterized protein n=1 Tax=Centruroides vittatus TaxID=120091 RepID=UPI00350EE98D
MKPHFLAICILSCLPLCLSFRLAKREQKIPDWATRCGIDFNPSPDKHYEQRCNIEEKILICIMVCKPGWRARDGDANSRKDFRACYDTGDWWPEVLPNKMSFSCDIESPGDTEQLAFSYGSEEVFDDDETNEESESEDKK